MTFETTDWETEAERLSQAFGLDEGVEFIEDKSGSMVLRFMGDSYPHRFEGIHVDVEYTRSQRLYGVTFLNDDLVANNKRTQWTRIGISWSGSITQEPKNWDYVKKLAYGLINLNLFTPEIEAALKFPITAQKRAEWALEEEWSEKYSLVHWEAEEKRIILAFDIEKNSGFTRLSSYRVFEGKTFDNLFIRLMKRLGNTHYHIHRQGSVLSDSHIMLDEQGVIVHINGSNYMKPLAKGLFFLGQLTPQNEKTLNVTISAHEKMEWALEYKNRVKTYEENIRKNLNKHYATINWAGEAEHIKQAFGINEMVEFCEHAEGMELRSKQQDKILLANGLQLNVIYTSERKGFTLTNSQLKSGMPWTNISLDWEGNVESNFGLHEAEALAKGLYHLGLLTIEVEKTLGIYAYSCQRENWHNKVCSIPDEKI